MPSMNLLIFITRWFCGNKENPPPSPPIFVRISDLKSYVAINGNKVRGQVVEGMKLLMKHVDI